MSRRPNEITDDNVLKVDVATIAKDRRFSELEFENAKEKLNKIQKWFLEMQDFSYEELLIQDDINRLLDFKNQLKGNLQDLLTFDNRTTRENAQEQHNALENRIVQYYNNVFQQLAMRILPFLRQEAARTAFDVQELEKQQKVAAQAQRDYETVKEQITKELKDIRARRAEVEKEQGEFIAIGLGKDFSDQAEQYQEKADNWLKQRNIWLRVLSYIISGNILLFFILLIGHLGNKNIFDPDIVFNFQYGAVKFALLLLLSYAIGFCSRNYNINSGLAATNRHRKNVAEVLLNALSSQLTDEAKSEIIHLAAKEMFKHLPVGYISKEHQSDSGPILEIAKQVFPKLKE